MGGGREHALLVFQEALGHRDRTGRRGVEGAPALEQLDDFTATVRGAGDDRVHLLLRCPSHGDQVGDRNASNGRVADERDHRVPMATKHERGHVLDRDRELVGKEQTEPRAVEHAGHAHHLVGRQPRLLLHHPDHRVERIGDDDHEGAGAMLLDALCDLGDHAGILGYQVVATHARRPRKACRHDHHVRPGNCRVIAAANHMAVKPVDGTGLHEVKRLSRGDPAEDVEQRDVTEFLQTDHVRERAANVPGTDEGDLMTCHASRLQDKDVAKAKAFSVFRPARLTHPPMPGNPCSSARPSSTRSFRATMGPSAESRPASLGRARTSITCSIWNTCEASIRMRSFPGSRR